MRVPESKLDLRYGSPSAELTTWDETRKILEQAELFWLSTVRANGHPHVTPLVAVWANDALHFVTGPEEQKVRNLDVNQGVVLTTGANTWNTGIDVVVEGVARRATPDDDLESIIQAYGTKWNGMWEYSIRDGKIWHEEGFEVFLYTVVPTKVLAFAKEVPAHNVHQFND